MKTVIKQEFLSSMLLEIIGEREQDQERERQRESEGKRKRERERLSRQRKKESIEITSDYISISAIINEFHM